MTSASLGIQSVRDRVCYRIGRRVVGERRLLRRGIHVTGRRGR